MLAGRAIAYTLAMPQVMRWAEQPGGDAAARAPAAIELIKADIDGIAREFSLLDAGVLDDEPTVALCRSVYHTPARYPPMPRRRPSEMAS